LFWDYSTPHTIFFWKFLIKCFWKLYQVKNTHSQCPFEHGILKFDFIIFLNSCNWIPSHSWGLFAVPSLANRVYFSDWTSTIQSVQFMFQIEPLPFKVYSLCFRLNLYRSKCTVYVSDWTSTMQSVQLIFQIEPLLFKVYSLCFRLNLYHSKCTVYVSDWTSTIQSVQFIF